MVLIHAIKTLTNIDVVLNVFEAVDVIALIKGGVYDDLSLTVGDALLKRSDVCCSCVTRPLTTGNANATQDFPGIFTCSLSDNMSTIYDTIRKSRVHRFIVIDSESRLKGVLTLSDVLEHTLLDGLEDDE
jgi:5'-AMP-activated protein kinase regulatory gamma subunit